MKKILGLTLLGLALIMTAYFSFVYFVPYSSDSKRATEKALKTWEGEISQGISGAQIFSFSVLKDDVIDKLKEYQGSYVKVTYIERYRTFFWLGDTKYFITSVEKENSPHLN